MGHVVEECGLGMVRMLCSDQCILKLFVILFQFLLDFFFLTVLLCEIIDVTEPEHISCFLVLIHDDVLFCKHTVR